MGTKGVEGDPVQKTVDGIMRMDILIDISARKLHSLQKQCTANFQKDIFQKEILEYEVILCVLYFLISIFVANDCRYSPVYMFHAIRFT